MNIYTTMRDYLSRYPHKQLVRGEYGHPPYCCALGAIVEIAYCDYNGYHHVSRRYSLLKLGIPSHVIDEVGCVNDAFEGTEEERYTYMMDWFEKKSKEYQP